MFNLTLGQVNILDADTVTRPGVECRFLPLGAWVLIPSFGLAFFHLSNAGIGENHPGTEALVGSLCIPMD